MASAIIEDAVSETGQDLAAIVRAGCFVSEAAGLARSSANAVGRQSAWLMCCAPYGNCGFAPNRKSFNSSPTSKSKSEWSSSAEEKSLSGRCVAIGYDKNSLA